MPELTGKLAKMERFCQEYIKDNNATQAAIRSGYSENSARQLGTQVLSNIVAVERIAELQKEVLESSQVDAKWLLKRLIETEYLDILDILEPDTERFKPIKDWPKVWRQSICGMDIITIRDADNVESVMKKIKWPDKVKNRELIGKHIEIGAFSENMRVQGVITISITEDEAKL